MPSVEELDDYMKNLNNVSMARTFAGTNGYGTDITDAMYESMKEVNPLFKEDMDLMLDFTANKLAKKVKDFVVYPSLTGIGLSALSND